MPSGLYGKQIDHWLEVSHVQPYFVMPCLSPVLRGCCQIGHRHGNKCCYLRTEGYGHSKSLLGWPSATFP